MSSAFLPSATASIPTRERLPRVAVVSRVLGVLGVLWNAFGVWQWLSTRSADADALIASGLSRSQAELYLSLPAWMDAAFGLGVLAGLIGSLLLAGRRRAALPVLTASLFAYAALFAGDAAFGLFAVLPRQLAVLSVVMLIAVGLLLTARHARTAGALR